MRDSVTKTLYRLRSGIVDRCGLLIAVAAIALLSQDRFSGIRASRQHWPELTIVGAVAVVLTWRALLGWTGRRSLLARTLDRLEFGLLLLLGAHILVQWAGGVQSWAQPVVYLLLAYLVGFNSRSVALLLTVATVTLQSFPINNIDAHSTYWRNTALRVGFVLAFALAYLIFLQVEVMRRRRQSAHWLEEKLAALNEEAREFRLISSALSSREASNRSKEEMKLARGAVDTIHQGMFYVLDLLKKTLELQTCILLWLDSSTGQLRVKELVTDSLLIRETPIPPQAGALGGIVKNRLLLNLETPKQASRGVPYYEGPETVSAFVGVPLLEDGHFRGVLCADRRHEKPFTKQEEELLVGASEQILRVIQTEQVFAAVERSKYEHERFYRASSILNNALTLSQVYDTAFAAAREMAQFDFGAITLYNVERHKHTICRVTGQHRERFEGVEFADNAGLVSMAVKNRHFLPAGDDLRVRDTVVFTRKLRLAAESLVVLPLIAKDASIGTIVLAAGTPGRFPKHVREMLGVLSNHVAVSLENAKMYKYMEEMATTDALTSLPNHRTFQQRFSEMLYRAERHGKPVSLILIDVDKFKVVNDTYGHPVGDRVLQETARVLAEQVRKVDIAARYGGEEFAIVLEETELAGAELLCERIRERVASQLLSSDKGSFRVTLSLGVASYPIDGQTKQTLIERADQALYAAKAGGRNCTMCYRTLVRDRGGHRGAPALAHAN